jgi:hypothetical protein
MLGHNLQYLALLGFIGRLNLLQKIFGWSGVVGHDSLLLVNNKKA